MIKNKYIEQTFTLEILYHIGKLENSIHFIFDHDSKTCAIVDPAWEANLFIQIVADKGYKLTDIWLTHWHGDHTNAVDEIADKTGAKITIGIHETTYLNLANQIRTVKDQDKISLGNTNATIIHTPGHSAGGICYLLDKHLIAGDSLFVYGAGHCSLPGDDMMEFYYSMQKFKQIEDHVMLHCGHDYGCKIETTMGEQKLGNAWLVIDNPQDFIQYMQRMSQGLIPYPTKALSKAEIQAML